MSQRNPTPTLARLREVASKPHVVNPLTVAINTVSKKRLVIDLREVNPCVQVDKLRFEDLKIASTYFKLDQFMCVFDLTSGYHHIEICAQHQTFLGFAHFLTCS